jgi:hypothetical protein
MRETLHGVMYEIRTYRGTRKGIEQETTDGIVGAKAMNKFAFEYDFKSFK